MTSRSPASIALYTTGAILTGLVGYAVYFDYMRRNSPEFRKNLKKQQKKLQLEADAQEKKQKEKNMKALRAAAIEVQNENPPSSPEAQEAYFQEHVAEGERIQAAGPDSYVEAATHFYRALRVYPQPVELLMIYQKVCPEPVFKLIIELTQLTATAAGPSGGMGGMGGMGGPGAAVNLTAPPRAEASVADIDDSAVGIELDEKEGTDSDNGASSATSAEGWDKLADEASKA